MAEVAFRVHDEENVMSVRRRIYRDPETGAVATRWMIDVDIQQSNGERKRVRKVCPVQNKRAAEQYERELRNELFRPAAVSSPARTAQHVAPLFELEKEVPTFAAFAKVFMATYAKANNKPSEQASKESILKLRLVPRFGKRRLDSFKVLDIDQLKADMLEENYNRKTINNAMAVWAKLLHYAQDQELIGKTPRFKFLKIREEKFDFFDFDELERLVAAAKEPDRQAMILLGSEAGLRMGEMLALTQDCVDYRAGNLTVWENDWQGNVGSTKGGERRTVPMTPRLRAALQAIRHLRGDLVLCGAGGERWTKHMVRAALRTICKRAGLRVVGAHVLRHTFCSHLAMRKAAPKAIQELAGHKSLKVTLRYMHLTETALRDTMRLLEQRGEGREGARDGGGGDEVTAR